MLGRVCATSVSLSGWLVAGSLKTSGVLVVFPLIALMVERLKTLRKRLRGIKSHLKTVSLASDSSLCTDSTFFCDPEALDVLDKPSAYL